jgi:ABC-type transport system involved in multi-copper enzyme maturation permease subunit
MNPILRRELVEMLRTRKALAMQLGLALACLFLVLLHWPSEDVADLSGARSVQVLRMFGYGLLAGILLLVPAFPATSLVREKVKGTLALLLNSPVPPWLVYAGKLGSVLGFAAALLVMTLPAAAASYALGGMGIQGGITTLYVLFGITAVQVSTLGLLVSCRSQSTDGALRVTYSLVLALCILPLVPQVLLPPQWESLLGIASWFRCLSPIPAVMEVLGQPDVGMHGLFLASGVVSRYILLALILSLGCALATIAGLNPTSLERSRPAGIMTQDRPAGQRFWRRLVFLVDPQRRSGHMSLWVNPVMVKEFRSRRFGRSHWLLRLIALSAILSLGLSYVAAIGAVGWSIEFIGGGLVLLQITLLILFAPSLGAGVVSAERERGSWQLLLMTPLSSGTILRGKLVSVIWPLVLLLCATLPGYVAMMTLEPALVPRVQRVVACLALTAVFVVLVSAATSTLFRSTATALTASYVAILTICLGPLLLWLGREAPFGHAMVQAALVIDPVAAALQASDTPGFNQFDLLPSNWWIIGITCLTLIVFLRLRVGQLCRPS